MLTAGAIISDKVTRVALMEHFTERRIEISLKSWVRPWKRSSPHWNDPSPYQDEITSMATSVPIEKPPLFAWQSRAKSTIEPCADAQPLSARGSPVTTLDTHPGHDRINHKEGESLARLDLTESSLGSEGIEITAGATVTPGVSPWHML